jgi:outer membrane protein OmpA-like peptidoglycan-associated protein
MKLLKKGVLTFTFFLGLGLSFAQSQEGKWRGYWQHEIGATSFQYYLELELESEGDSLRGFCKFTDKADPSLYAHLRLSGHMRGDSLFLTETAILEAAALERVETWPRREYRLHYRNAGSLAFLKGRVSPILGSGNFRVAPGKVLLEQASTSPKKPALPSSHKEGELPDTLRAGERLKLPGLHFERGTAALRPEAQKQLDKIAALLKKHKDLKVEIAGHTESLGDRPRNLKLSSQRAHAVREALIARGIPEKLLTAKGYGGSEPLSTDPSPEAQAQNRRVELRVVGRFCAFPSEALGK